MAKKDKLLLLGEWLKYFPDHCRSDLAGWVDAVETEMADLNLSMQPGWFRKIRPRWGGWRSIGCRIARGLSLTLLVRSGLYVPISGPPAGLLVHFLVKVRAGKKTALFSSQTATRRVTGAHAAGRRQLLADVRKVVECWFGGTLCQLHRLRLRKKKPPQRSGGATPRRIVF